MRMTIINKETGEVEQYIECDKIRFMNAVKAINVFGNSYTCKRANYKPWEIVYFIESSRNQIVIPAERYILSFR